MLDGFIIGALRAFPAVTFQSAILGPFIEGEVHTMEKFQKQEIFALSGGQKQRVAIAATLAGRTIF